MDSPESYMYYMETFSLCFQLVLQIPSLFLTWKMRLENGLERSTEWLKNVKTAIKEVPKPN